MSSARCTLLAVIVGLVACGPADNQPQTGSMPGPEPAVVYMVSPGAAALEPVFADFTETTGIPVSIREAPAEKNLQDVIGNVGAPPADILLTDGIADIWLAGDEGALRRLGSMGYLEAVPELFRDPDGQWFSIGADPLVIVVASAGDAARVAAYADLADPAYAGQLCLSASQLPENRLLIAHLIAEHGQRPAERIVRRWLENLALPPRSSAAGLLAELQSGACRYALAKRSDVTDMTAPLPYRLPAGDGAVFVSAYGIGIARHARYPESATRLLDWLAGPGGQSQFALATRTLSTLGTPPGEWATRPLAELGWLDAEARRLAERARWR